MSAKRGAPPAGTAAPSRRGSRKLTSGERELWKTVTTAVRPLRAGSVSDQNPETVPPEAQAADAPAAAEASPRPSRAPRQGLAQRPPAAKPPPLAPLDRRQKQRVARGTVPIDARLDLHGMTQARAHAALARFIRAAQADGATFVLVITGKGARAYGDTGGGERGVLRRLVPEWLALPEFRSGVVGFEPAHQTHGGEGALYIRLRRGR